MITRTRTIVIAAIATALIGGAAVAFVLTSKAPRVAPSGEASLATGRQADGTTSLPGGSGGSESATPSPLASEAAALAPMTTSDWDAYIAQQYPGYRIEQRTAVPDQFKAGLLGVNYVLGNKRRPGFTLLVCLAQLSPAETFDDAPEAYVGASDRIVTNDALFSASSSRGTDYLADGAQDAIIDAYVAKRPSADAVAFRGFGDEGTLVFTVATGPEAVARAIKSYEDFDYIVETGIPSGPRNATVRVIVTRR